MKTRFLVTTVSFIALPLAILTSSTSASAQNTCGTLDFACQASRLGYYVTHLGNETPAPAPAAPAQPAAPAVAPVISNNNGGTFVSDHGAGLVRSIRWHQVHGAGRQ